MLHCTLVHEEECEHIHMCCVCVCARMCACVCVCVFLNALVSERASEEVTRSHEDVTESGCVNLF